MEGQKYIIEFNEEQMQLMIELSGSLNANLQLLKMTSHDLKELRTKLLDSYQKGWRRKEIKTRKAQNGFYWETEA